MEGRRRKRALPTTQPCSMFCLGHKNFYGHSQIGTDQSKMFLYYKLIVFLICVVIFSTTAEEYEHSDTEIVTSDGRKSVLRGLYLGFSGVLCLFVALTIAATSTGLSHHVQARRVYCSIPLVGQIYNFLVWGRAHSALRRGEGEGICF